MIGRREYQEGAENKYQAEIGIFVPTGKKDDKRRYCSGKKPECVLPLVVTPLLKAFLDSCVIRKEKTFNRGKSGNRTHKPGCHDAQDLFGSFAKRVSKENTDTATGKAQYFKEFDQVQDS